MVTVVVVVVGTTSIMEPGTRKNQCEMMLKLDWEESFTNQCKNHPQSHIHPSTIMVQWKNGCISSPRLVSFNLAKLCTFKLKKSKILREMVVVPLNHDSGRKGNTTPIQTQPSFGSSRGISPLGMEALPAPVMIGPMVQQ